MLLVNGFEYMWSLNLLFLVCFRAVSSPPPPPKKEGSFKIFSWTMSTFFCWFANFSYPLKSILIYAYAIYRCGVSWLVLHLFLSTQMYLCIVQKVSYDHMNYSFIWWRWWKSAKSQISCVFFIIGNLDTLLQVQSWIGPCLCYPFHVVALGLSLKSFNITVIKVVMA